jgi:hypothetical protein
MKLSPDWFIEYPVDCEHKKWILLAALRDVKHDFDNRILYPHLPDIKYHIQNLEKWSTTRELYIKKELKGFDFEKMTLIYDTPENSPEMSELDDITKYSISMFKKAFNFGKDIWREVESQMKWYTIGIIPQYKQEGFIMLRTGKEVRVYRYGLNSVILDSIPNSDISFTEISKEEYGLGVYESLKLKLMRETDLPAPLTLAIESEYYPIDLTLLPIIKTIAVNKIKSF